MRLDRSSVSWSLVFLAMRQVRLGFGLGKKIWGSLNNGVTLIDNRSITTNRSNIHTQEWKGVGGWLVGRDELNGI